ncbi:hypothetical protein BDD12DRAFT_894032 [Trichophaea hybrida]|nr:hypothetical protein BDD12DRAFT_894032 [Trichophaea hybrida]
MTVLQDIVVTVLTVAAWTSVVNGQQYNPRTDFCRRFSHDAAVVGPRLYINDGQLNLAGKGGKNFTNDRLLFHDLTTTVLDGKSLDMPLLDYNLSKPSEVPSVIGGILWADATNGRLFQYGGEFPDPAVPEDQFQLWSYDVYGNNWTTEKLQDQSITRVSFGAGTTVEHLGMGYYLGGYQSQRSNINWQGAKKASNRMIEYDMVQNKWNNRTGPNDLKGRAEGVLFYTPYGDNGMLVAFGGVRFANTDNAVEEPSPMSTIDVYDMGSQKWYTQNATGDIPENRRRFCGGIATAADGSSANIYLYGGLGFGVNATGFDDVYILSIPSFTWIQIYPAKGTPRKKDEENPHYDLSCTVVKNAQLLIIGGQFPKDPDAKNCDAPDVWGVHNLVMSKLDTGAESVYWAKYNSSRDKYSVPDDIIKAIGGDGKGSAQIKSPKNGFDSQDLEVLFRRTISITSRTPTRTSPALPDTTSPNNGASGPFSTPAKRARILAPAIIGGIALLALAFFLIRRYRTKKAAAGGDVVTPNGATSDNPPGYKPRDSVAPATALAGHPLSAYPTGNAPPLLPGQAWAYQPVPPQHPPADPMQQYPTGYSYSEYSEAQTTPARVQSPVELPQGPVPPSPEPSDNDGPWLPQRMPAGHYPPPLPDNFVPGRSPEMKERDREK